MFFIASSIRGSSFFYSFNYLSFELQNVIFAETFKLPCSRFVEYLLEILTSELISPAYLIKTCTSFDIKFGRWPRVTKSLLANAAEYWSWTKGCGWSSCLTDNNESIGTCNTH